MPGSEEGLGYDLRTDVFFAEVDGRQYWTGPRFYAVPGAPCTDLRII